jgi:hypothetical protein
MRKTEFKYMVVLLVLMATGGCEGLTGPKRTGKIQLSSQLFGTDTYYIFGYGYEQGEYYRYPFKGEPVPDIINEAFRVIEGGKVTLLPGFNTPGQMNGFALAREFGTLESARNFYNEYLKVEDGLQFETISDTVELYQVWIQQTVLGNYVKLLIQDIQTYEGEAGSIYNEITMEYTYQPDGSSTFPD